MNWARQYVGAFALAAVEALTAICSACAQAPGATSRGTAEPVTTRELVEASGLSGLAVSPDGAYAVVRVDRQDVTTNRTHLSWHVVRLRDGRTTRIADAGAPRWNNNGYVAIEAPQWSPDSASIHYRKLQGEEVQLWRTSRDGVRHEQLTHDAADVQAFMVASDGGIHYAVGPATRDEIKTAEASEYDNGVLLDDTVIKGFPVIQSFPVNGRMATFRRLPGGAGRATLLGDTPLRVMSLDAQGRVRPASEAVARQIADLWSKTYVGARPFEPGRESRSVSPDLRRIASLGPSPADSTGNAPSRSGDFLSWRRDDRPAAPCLDPLCRDADHIAIVGWTKDSARLVFQTRTFDTVRLLAWDVLANTVHTLMQTKGVLGSYDSGADGECRLASLEAICIAAAADAPPRLLSVDLHTGRQRILFDPNPGLTPDRLGVAQEIVLHDRFGGSTVGRLVLPAARDPRVRLPLVITSYACDGFLLGGSGRDVPEHVLVGKGYAAVCIDLDYDMVRRRPGGAPTQDDVISSGRDFFEDAVRMLDRQGVIDPGRVALTGFSGGATAAAFAIAHSARFTAAAVTTEGSLDPIACYLTAHYRSCANLAWREGHPRPYDSRSGIMRNSPALNVEKITTPLLMQLPEVEYASMMQLYGAMLDYGRAVEMYIFADAYHYKNQARQRLAVYDRNVDWIDFWLRGTEASRPDRSNQYDRWRLMRENHCQLLAGNAAMPATPWYCRS